MEALLKLRGEGSGRIYSLLAAARKAGTDLLYHISEAARARALTLLRVLLPEPREEITTIVVHSASAVPKMDVIGHSDTYVQVSAVIDGRLAFSAATPIIKGTADPVWEHEIPLDGFSQNPSDVTVRFEMMDKDHLLPTDRTNEFIGQAELRLAELLKQPSHTLLMQNRSGDPVLRWSNPPTPCELKVSAQLGGRPLSGAAASSATKQYPKHIFMMSRGTRGDVQPFLALARGMASQRGWLVTICTELAWKDFVEGKATDGCGDGAVRFLPSGGDTALQTSTWVAGQAMKAKTEVMQTIMMAAAESNFFASAPVIATMIERAGTEQAIDLLVPGFTLTGVGLLLSERFEIPLAAFCLQPTCIPSRDPEWRNVIPIESHGLSLLERVEKGYFTSHAALQSLKTCFESAPMSSLSLPKLRGYYGLPPSHTWRSVFEQDIPMVIPMLPGTFDMPGDWNPRIEMTDFIFLRSSAPGAGKLSQDVAQFCDEARKAGRKLVLMTFSSMPVPRAVMLECAVKMVDHCKHAMSLIYVGPQQQDKPPKALMARTDELKADGKLLEAARADFGVLFREMDAFIVHGGLGSTVEAMRMKKPVCVTGILLMDQRFWGKVCHEKGIGPPPVHIDDFHKSCVDFVDEALDPQSSWLAAAATLEMGDEADDGVAANVNHFAELMESGLKPVRACRGSWVEAADQCRVSRSSAAEAEAETASAA